MMQRYKKTLKKGCNDTTFLETFSVFVEKKIKSKLSTHTKK